METPEQLQNLWRTRGGQWFAKNYQDAVERIDHVAAGVDTMFMGQTDEDYIQQPRLGISDRDGRTLMVEEARAKAMELLVLCDLAELGLIGLDEFQ